MNNIVLFEKVLYKRWDQSGKSNKFFNWRFAKEKMSFTIQLRINDRDNNDDERHIQVNFLS